MASHRQTQVAEMLMHHAADYFARESNRESLITMTGADVSPDLRNAKIYFSVLPIRFEDSALAFAKRSRSDFREYLKAHARMQYLPTVDFELDYGEKNRQRVDELTRS